MSVSRLCAATSLANQAATLALGETSPDALLLADAERMFQAHRADRTLAAHDLGLDGFVEVIVWIKYVRIKAAARALVEPEDLWPEANCHRHR